MPALFTHPTVAALLRAVCADPADDTVRLHLADWLEEHGGGEGAVRAEFIRVQCRLAEPFVCEWEATDGMPCPQYNAAKTKPYRTNLYCPTCAAREHLLAEELRLFDTLGANPFGECFDGLSTVTIHPELFDKGRRSYHDEAPSLLVRRGFVEGVAMTLAVWLDHGAVMLRRTPLRVVCLRSEPVDTENRLRGVHSMLRRLACDDEPGDNPVARLDTLDLSRLSVNYFQLGNAMDEAYRPWRGLRRLILPNWADLQEQYRPHYVEQWKQRVPTLEAVEFGGDVCDWRQQVAFARERARLPPLTR